MWSKLGSSCAAPLMLWARPCGHSSPCFMLPVPCQQIPSQTQRGLPKAPAAVLSCIAALLWGLKGPPCTGKGLPTPAVGLARPSERRGKAFFLQQRGQPLQETFSSCIHPCWITLSVGRLCAGVQGWHLHAGLCTAMYSWCSGLQNTLLFCSLSCSLCILLCLPLPFMISYPSSLPPLICKTYLTSGNSVNHGELTKSWIVQATAARCADCIFTAQIILCCSWGWKWNEAVSKREGVKFNNRSVRSLGEMHSAVWTVPALSCLALPLSLPFC